MNVTVTAPPLGDLVASAGDDKDVDSGQTVTLDGSGTASDSVRTVSYLWTRSVTGGTLTGETTLTPSFMAPALTAGAADVTYVFTLTVTDDQSSTPATDTVNVTVTAPPLGDLVASAGDDKDVDSGQTVTLDGRYGQRQRQNRILSLDPDWHVHWPAGAVFTVTLTLAVIVTYVFTDGYG